MGPDGKQLLEEKNSGNYFLHSAKCKERTCSRLCSTSRGHQWTNGKPFSECGQAKQGQNGHQVIQDERAKSCDADDVFDSLLHRGETHPAAGFASNDSIVQPAQWREHFGPKVERAWQCNKTTHDAVKKSFALCLPCQ